MKETMSNFDNKMLLKQSMQDKLKAQRQAEAAQRQTPEPKKENSEK